jgi:acetyl-CoA C-acetyltransferase
VTLPSSTPVVVAARRTPIGTAGHALRDVTVDQLAAATLRAVTDDLAAVGISPPPDQVVLGNCMGPGGNVARVGALAAGLPPEVPAMTVDLQCGSGLAAVTTACALVRSGAADLVLAGGAESASTAPWRSWPPEADGVAARRYLRAPFTPADLGDPDMGVAADDLARLAGISRDRQDAYAARSHERAAAAHAAGRFACELVPVAGLDRDERVRSGLDVATLARLRPAFVDGGTVTAGNSCGVSDGAAVVAIVSEQIRAGLGLPGLAIRDWAVSGVDPRLPGRGPVPAISTLVQRNDIELGDIDAIELNEAFAGQVLACCDELGLDDTRVCVEGGALALGHPWGASGAVLLVRLFGQLVAHADLTPGPTSGGRRLGLAAIAVGGGQGVAALVERVG